MNVDTLDVSSLQTSKHRDRGKRKMESLGVFPLQFICMMNAALQIISMRELASTLVLKCVAI